MRKRHLGVVLQATLFAAVVGAALLPLDGPAWQVWLLLCVGTALLWMARGLADGIRHRRLRQELAASPRGSDWLELDPEAVESRLAPLAPAIRGWLTDGRATGFVRWHVAQAWAHRDGGATVFELHAWPGFHTFGIPLWRTLQVGRLGALLAAAARSDAPPEFATEGDGQHLNLWARQRLDAEVVLRLGGPLPSPSPPAKA